MNGTRVYGKLGILTYYAGSEFWPQPGEVLKDRPCLKLLKEMKNLTPKGTLCICRQHEEPSEKNKQTQACEKNGSLRSGLPPAPWILASNAAVPPWLEPFKVFREHMVPATQLFVPPLFVKIPALLLPWGIHLAAHHWEHLSNRLIPCWVLQDSGRSNFCSPAWGWTWDAVLSIPTCVVSISGPFYHLRTLRMFVARNVLFSFNCLLRTGPFWRSLVVADFLAASSRLQLACGILRYW